MQAIDYNFLIIQTLAGLAVTAIGLITALIVLKKDSKFILNRLFASALSFMGLSMLFFAFGNVPIILNIDPGLQTTITIITMQLFLSFLVLSFTCFLYSGFVLLYGANQAFDLTRKIILVVIVLLSLIIIWFTQSVITIGTQGNIETGHYVNIVLYPLILVLYLSTMYFYYKVYQESEADIKPQIKLFLIGWVIAGISLVSSALSNFITYGRILDLVSPLILCLSLIFVYQGFREKKSKSEEN